MKRPRFTIRHVGGKTPLGNRRGPWHVIDRIANNVVSSHETHRQARIHAKVLSIEEAPGDCPEYRPDHNTECVLCDERIEDHSLEAIAAGEAREQNMTKITWDEHGRRLVDGVLAPEERCALHGVEQCPLCYPQPKIPFRPEPLASQYNMAMGKDGNPLPYSPDEVKQVMQQAVNNGALLAALFALPNGDLSFQVFGPPSWALFEDLQGALSQYKRALELQIGPPSGKA